ncbi:hypothetical protein GWI33_002552 [Rhynchophorus ferrugineus]|uniref:Glycosyl transferase CAP10 domain-containing protein n=1 Tax=Rhynchophorus ferrugineus TaxID=354439 RepID=A0A834MKD0_RHYFE|nr:hypothetical protein GWI33_002552 [Rhynchophorus ferrugineus]
MVTFAEEFQRSWLTSLIGLLVFCGGVYLLTWNEGRAIHHHHSLEETYNNAITLNVYDRLQPEYDGRVVHITGDLIVDEPLTEPEYGISVQSVKLKRRVQMYQWVEERTSRDDDNNDMMQGSNADYYYVTEWRDKLVDSSNFYIRHGHENPTKMPLQTTTYISPYVRVGPLLLSQELKEKFSDYNEVTSDERPDRRDIKLHLGIYYHCQDVWNPEVGDIRVQFYYAGQAGDPVSIIAKQENGMLVPYVTSKGRQIALVRYGNLNRDEMLKAEFYDAKIENWKLRFFGAAFIHFAITCLSKLIKLIFNQIPYLRNTISGEATDAKNIQNDDEKCTSDGVNKYSKEANTKYVKYLKLINEAKRNYKGCNENRCNCHAPVIARDLKIFKDKGISAKLLDNVKTKGTKYQIINNKLYRDKMCMFPARCTGIEHFLLENLSDLPDTEFIVNTRDWPQINKKYGFFGPVFSFSKTDEYYDIMYPAWAFWEGGPAISLYPKGIGRWDNHRLKLGKLGNLTKWENKIPKAFFRGSRTCSERDPLVLLSRENPGLVDAQYTKNQAWKSDAY